MQLTNQQAAGHTFLKSLSEDEHAPEHVLGKGRAILRRLCARIETEQPAGLEELYALTRVATEEFNDLEAEFDEAGSEIDTIAREEIAEDFWFVATAYGFTDADAEELVAARNW